MLWDIQDWERSFKCIFDNKSRTILNLSGGRQVIQVVEKVMVNLLNKYKEEEFSTTAQNSDNEMMKTETRVTEFTN